LKNGETFGPPGGGGAGSDEGIWKVKRKQVIRQLRESGKKTIHRRAERQFERKKQWDRALCGNRARTDNDTPREGTPPSKEGMGIAKGASIAEEKVGRQTEEKSIRGTDERGNRIPAKSQLVLKTS